MSRRSDDDFAEEIRAHLEIEADRLRAEGASEDEARARASRTFGNVTAARERFYESGRPPVLDALARDVRYALRGLRRAPGFAAAAIVTLALGIGANTAIFSAVDEVLFRAPALPDAGRLAQVYSFQRKTSTYVSSSYPDYVDLRGASSFQSLAAYVRLPLAVSLGEGGAERISIDAVSGNYFDTLGAPPIAGRALRAEDDRPGAPAVAWIADGLWRRRFHADAAAPGKTIEIEGQRFTIAGVMPDRFGDLNLNWATPPQIWIPLRAVTVVAPRLSVAFENRAVPWLVLTGRLRAGVTAKAAQAELQTIADRDLTAVVLPLSRSKFWPAYRTSVANSLAAFAVAAGLLLLLACANVSNLLLERAAGRRREFAVRLAIGAGRGGILRQVLTESAVLALLGCAASVAVAQALMTLLGRFPNALGLPLTLDLRIEGRALALCMALSLAATLLAGLAPAVASMRTAFLPALKDSARGARAHWFHGGLIAVQAALSMVLLTGGGLYGRTLWRAYSADLGFRADHLLTGAFSTPLAGAGASARFRGQERAFLKRMAVLPGVVSVSVSSGALLSGAHQRVQVDGGDGARAADREFVGADYVATTGMKLEAGREFTERDGASAPRVAIVNDTLAAALWPGANPLGRVVTVVESARKRTPVAVVGVVRTAKYGSVWEQAQPRFYVPAEQSDFAPSYFLVRTNGRPEELERAASAAWSEIAPGSPLYGLETGEERVDASLMPERVAAGILGGFGALALALTAVGLYSVVAFAVAQQRREIGIRMAVGATPGAVTARMLRRSMTWVAAGIAAGGVGSVAAVRVLATNARGVSPYDPATYLAVVVGLVGIGAAAAIGPARRAARIDPASVLRGD
jgi:macrolide transport system ATP-binding/permease protein